MARYSHGEWYAVVTPTGVAMLPQSVPPATLDQVWAALRAGDGLGAVIEGLVGAFGTSLSSLPEFAVLSVSGDEVRVAVRGGVLVELRRGSAAETLSGAGVTTWSERVLAGVTEAAVTAPGAAASGPLLPVADGIVLASAVHFGADHPIPAVVSPVPADAVGPAAPTPSAPPAPPSHPGGPAPVSPPPPEEPAVPVAPHPAPVAPEVGGLAGYEQLLFGETVAASVEGAAVREPDAEADDLPVPPPGPAAPPAAAPAPEEPVEPAAPAPPQPPGLISGIPPLQPPPAPPRPAGGATTLVPDPAGDHDGETVLGAAPRPPATAGAPAGRRPPVLLAPGAPRVVLDRSAIVGTRPRLSRVQGPNAPHLVSVHSPNGEISRTHLELRVEGTTVLAVDLDSTNGTLLLRTGADPVRLHPGEPTMLVAGDRIDLGDGVVLDFEGIA